MKKRISSLLAFGVISSAITVHAGAQDSFTGAIGLGVMFIDSANSLNPNSSDDRIGDLNSSAAGDSSGVIALRLDAAWDVGMEDGLKLYFTTTPPIDEVGDFALDMGATYTMQGIGIWDAAVFFSPFEEAWEDPYLVGIDREETGTSKYGAKIGLNRILGTGLRVNLVYMSDDVDDDLIGERIPELARDGAVRALNMNYSFHLTDTLEIRPRLSLRQGDYDGDANSYVKYKAELEARYRMGKIALIPRVYCSYSEYDEVNPLFNETREDDGYGVSLIVNYRAPFNLENWSVTGRVGVSEGDSNIDFYDTESISAGGFVSYHF